MVIKATDAAVHADVPANLKARLALAALQGEPAPWSRPEAKQAGVTPADVAAWRKVLITRAEELLEAQGPETLTSLKQERDVLKVQLALRFEEIAILIRLLNDKSSLFPRLNQEHFQEMRGALQCKRRRIAYRLKALQIPVVSAIPQALKRRVKAIAMRSKS